MEINIDNKFLVKILLFQKTPNNIMQNKPKPNGNSLKLDYQNWLINKLVLEPEMAKTSDACCRSVKKLDSQN